MQSLIDQLFEIRDLAAGLNNSLQTKFSVTTNSMPIAGLNMSANKIVLAIELMDHYESMFDVKCEAALANEQSQRVIENFNSCFVGIMSAIESCSRKAVGNIPKIFGPPPKTFFNLIEKSTSLGIVRRDDEVIWKKLISMRNALVHNNGEFKEFDELQLPGDIKWRFRPGAQSKVTHWHMLACLKWVVSSYGAWCFRYLDIWSLNFSYKPSWNRFYSYEITVVKEIPSWGLDGWANAGGWSWSWGRMDSWSGEFLYIRN